MHVGIGIGFGQANLVRQTREMAALPINLAISPLDVWLTSHRELFT